MELIFGRDFKLEAADPYLFYAYEFRKFSLSARLIVVIGYGFGDDHINKILSQALAVDAERQLFIISDCRDNEAQQQIKSDVTKRLGAKEEQLTVNIGTAKEFLQSSEVANQLLALLPGSAKVPF